MVAQRVGVTTPSIYRHFKDKDDLMDAVCKEAFEKLAEALEKAAASTDAPLERLFAQGHAYVDFALANPEEYRIVFMGDCKPKNTDGFLTDRCFTQVVDTVQACMDAGLFRPSPAGAFGLALQLWACAHGLASLFICKSWLPWGERAEVVESVLVMCSSGAALKGRLLGQSAPVIAGELAALAGGSAARATGHRPRPGAKVSSSGKVTTKPRGGGTKRVPTQGSRRQARSSS